MPIIWASNWNIKRSFTQFWSSRDRLDIIWSLDGHSPPWSASSLSLAVGTTERNSPLSIALYACGWMRVPASLWGPGTL